MHYLVVLFTLLFTIPASAAQDPITINEGKLIEIHFNSQLKADDLEDIKMRLAAINISIEYPKVEFNKKGKLKSLEFKVDCNDGFKGSAWSPRISKRMNVYFYSCLLYTSPSPRDRTRSRMPSSA